METRSESVWEKGNGRKRMQRGREYEVKMEGSVAPKIKSCPCCKKIASLEKRHEFIGYGTCELFKFVEWELFQGRQGIDAPDIGYD